MHSKNNSNNQEEETKKSFIEQARRAQIVEATIAVLAEQGYLNTSFSRIAAQAGISASLISYHFKSKEELTEAVYTFITQQRQEHVAAQVAGAATATDRLRIMLEADLAYMGTRPELFQALLEILFVGRSKTDAQSHRADVVHAGFMPIAEVLKAGQASGEFGDFDAFNLAIIIDSARDGFLGQLAVYPEFDLEQFTATLMTTVLTLIKKDK